VASVDALASLQPTNVACALAAALELGLTIDQIAARLQALQPVANRATVVTAPSGVVVIDDTFNANPASAAASLRLLTSLQVTGRRVVVTPGMIELGDEQYRENARFARLVADQRVELVVVNRTNVPALRDGYDSPLRRFNHRDDAVAWVRSSLRAGDAVLYLNDLPDHYP
jgi:UDP-N-acetylmuramoyl-tripeptide--D-alanyl-D-alanine ligase